MSQIYNMAFLRRNLFCKVWPPELGLQFSTSVLCWSFADESFWRGRSVGMSEIVSYAKSMAVTRFREARSGEAFQKSSNLD